ncbi:MAG TPA: chromosome segregation protein SMC [Cyclobacteriaceae bacterium]|nr:chromosome segregation protein SMC [Cyclobacteriaceae bacterium]
MELVKLEIKGFKSFGDKVTINFDKGITGIVGPNGCGKSNIVDAIRWVLGEQKVKTLRSEKLENIIFNGSKNRKPLQLAEASITFNNTRNILPIEYSTVTVTRRYYRTGESEYLLNGIPCRLKDITDLFLDTGIASHSYAIIELSMVDEILTDKDNARRHLFEEAAGVSKLRVRKKETIRKLEATDMDLERVEDLLFEIDKNMNSLEKQARQTEKYFKYKEEYKDLSIRLARVSLKSHHNSVAQIQKQIDAENDRKVLLNKKVAENEAEIEKARASLVVSEKNLAARQKSLNEFVNRISQAESDKRLTQERIKFLTDNGEHLRNQIGEDKKRNEQDSLSLEGLRHDRDTAMQALEETGKRLAGLDVELAGEKALEKRLEEELESLNQAYRSCHEDVFRISKDIEIREVQIATMKQELEKSATDSTENTASLVVFDAKISEISSELAERNAELDKMTKSEEDTLQRIAATEKTIEVIRDEMNDANRRLDAKQNEYNLIKSLVDNLEGFPEAIRFLRKQKIWSKDAPLLSDILTCEEKYRVTVENYLEPYMNYYVVENESEAFLAVNLLSEASKGRAHFFILEAFDYFVPTPIRFYENSVPATEIVEYDSKFTKLISYILDNVYLFNGQLIDLPKGEDAIFITAGGKLTKRRFSLSGGSVGLFEGKKIGRARNLEKLESEIRELNKKLEIIRQELAKETHEISLLKTSSRKEQIAFSQSEINQLNESLISYRTRKEQYAEMIRNQSTKNEDILNKVVELQGEIAALMPDSAAKYEELQALQARIDQLQAELRKQHEVVESKLSGHNEVNLLYHQQKNRISSFDQEIAFKSHTLESSRERVEKNTADLQRSEEEIQALTQLSALNDSDIVKMYREKEEMEAGLNESERVYYSARGTIDDLEKSVRELQHTREQADALLMDLNSSQNDVKLQLSSMKERLSVEFNVDLSDIEGSGSLEDESVPEEELRNQVVQVKDRMERIGPINPMAMDAYNEIKQRFDFITDQKDDLMKAKDSLKLTMDEIDVAAKTCFMEAYEGIKTNFVKVFQTLFSEGDDCDLIILEPEDPLNSGIEIIAKPKGKKPLTINQLSGGEKTLTATSLLFAIYLMKPAPFCIFDEVDAPLDDVNLDKFNNIIRTFSRDSQFIIVTHNKRTMSASDIIYGITMVEEGVSKVVPVSLKELEV